MRLFKKLGLFGFLTILMAGLLASVNFVSSNESHNTIENNVSKQVATAQHFFDANKKSADNSNDPSVDEIEEDLADYVTLTVSKIAYSDLGVYISAKFTATDSYMIYSLGYVDASQNINMPALLELQVQDSNGNVLDGVYSSTVVPDSKGLLSVDYSENISIESSILIPVGTTIIETSIKVTNIFYCREYKNVDPETGGVTYTAEVVTDKAFTKRGTVRKTVQVTSFADFGVITPKNISKYVGHYAIQLEFETTLTLESYLAFQDKLNPTFSKDKAKVADLESGKSYINIQFVLTKFTSFIQVIDSKGNIHDVPAFPCAKNMTLGVNNLVLNIPSDGIEDIVDVNIVKPMLTISAIKKETNTFIASSSFSYRFGTVSTRMVEILDYNNQTYSPAHPVDFMNTDIWCGVIVVIIAVLFVGAAIGQYFYRDIKYRNDEFKRLDKVAYLKTAIVAFVFFIFSGLDIYYLALRTTTCNNAETFANPLDVMVIVFTLIAFLLGCYFIRKYYISFKETLEKRRREKLNLNVKTEDDSGTISAEFAKTESSDKKETSEEVAESK